MKNKKGSIFQKLIVSYVVFTFIAIFLTMLCLVIGVILSTKDDDILDFPNLDIAADGTINNIDGITKKGGWVEQIDKEYNVVKVYGDRKISATKYSPELIIMAKAQSQNSNKGKLKDDDIEVLNEVSDYHMFWQTYGEGYYLIYYPKDSLNVVYTFNINKIVTDNIAKWVVWVILAMLILDVLCVSLYLSKKIRKPMDNLINGMKRVEAGEEKVQLSMNAEKEFVELQDAFNRMVEQLAYQKSINEDMNKSRQNMLLELSHDIKTPVATIKSYAAALKEGMVPEEQKDRYYETIALKADRVNNMSEDLFTMLKMESLDYELNLSKVDICELVRQICAEYYEEISQTGYDMDISIPEDKVFIEGDEKLLLRVISNLLINAKNYNSKGHSINISLFNKGKDVIIKVLDDGEEIDKQVQSLMFNPFARGESARRSSNGGTGLGLAIAKAVVNKHKGELSYKREENYNVFAIVLPINL